MKLLRFGLRGAERPGMLDEHGHIRDLSAHFSDFNPKMFADVTFLERLNDLRSENLPLVDPSVRLGPCVDAPGKILCVGFNSRAHALEMGMTPMPDHEVMVFIKANTSLCGPNDNIIHTRHCKKLDWEAELAIVIGKQGKYIPRESAKDHIFGYACFNDLSERYLQFETHDKQFTKGKCLDNAAPLGPYLVTKDAVSQSSNLKIQLWVNNILRQDFNTGDYIHHEEELVAYLSQFFTLYPGDIISMGSAPGSALYWGVEHYLKPNDVVEIAIEGLGRQKQLVVAEAL